MEAAFEAVAAAAMPSHHDRGEDDDEGDGDEGSGDNDDEGQQQEEEEQEESHDVFGGVGVAGGTMEFCLGEPEQRAEHRAPLMEALRDGGAPCRGSNDGLAALSV